MTGAGGVLGLRAAQGVLATALVLALAGATAEVFPPSAEAAGAQGGARGQAASSLLYATFFGVAAASAHRAWAVGQYQAGTVLRTLIVAWNGKTWQRVRSPNPAAAGDSLTSVAATSARNAWAVGEQKARSLILRWDGKAWRLVRSPDIGNLTSVAATSAANAWAVGIGGSKGDKTAIEHWNGKAWRVVRSPVRNGNLDAVAATSARNAWAVGFSGTSTASKMLAEQWNGTAWRAVHSPDPARAGVLLGVAATSSDSAWAVSGAAGQTAGTSISVINHWNGRAWRRVASPNPVPAGATLYGVVATSRRNAWAVGTDFVYFLSSPQNIIEHWDGKAWKLTHSPIADGGLFGVTATSAANVWAVGSGDNGAIIEHWNGSRWNGTTFG